MVHVLLVCFTAVALCIAVVLPPAFALLLLHRYTHRPSVIWAWMLGTLLYLPAVGYGFITAFTAWTTP